jgi:UDP-N-acetylmuramyl pentapeptide phosphotransferase/UDP-N-acetylglucosamine-1-phosphate transferase
MVIAVAASGTVAVSLSYVMQPLLIATLSKRGVLDIPNQRSSHQAPVPRGGGIGVACAASLGIACAAALPLDIGPAVFWPVLGAAASAALVGSVDDFRGGLPAIPRLWIQLVISAAVVASCWEAWPESFPAASPALALLMSAGLVAFVVGYLNAFNFMDGVNGISAVNAILVSVWYAMLATANQVHWLVVVSVALGCAALGFLPWNFPSGRIFLGDAGSYFFGVAFAALAVMLWGSGASLLVVSAPLLVYLFDTGLTLAHRAIRGESLLEAHRDHLYQRIAHRLGHAAATGTTVVASALCMCVSAFAAHVERVEVALFALFPLCAYVAVAWRCQRQGAGS